MSLKKVGAVGRAAATPIDVNISRLCEPIFLASSVASKERWTQGTILVAFNYNMAALPWFDAEPPRKRGA
jgi:hypothetical protein